MPKVICWEMDCLHNTDGRCRADEVEYDPYDGCLTLEPQLDFQDSDDLDDAGSGGGQMYLRGQEV